LLPASSPSHVHPLSSLHFFFYSSPAHRHLHSFPTRRSPDLAPRHAVRRNVRRARARASARRHDHPAGTARGGRRVSRPGRQADRSEEHTSELQSRENLVCRLLLEKKKKKKKQHRKQKHKPRE